MRKIAILLAASAALLLAGAFAFTADCGEHKNNIAGGEQNVYIAVTSHLAPFLATQADPKAAWHSRGEGAALRLRAWL